MSIYKNECIEIISKTEDVQLEDDVTEAVYTIKTSNYCMNVIKAIMCETDEDLADLLDNLHKDSKHQYNELVYMIADRAQDVAAHDKAKQKKIVNKK